MSDKNLVSTERDKELRDLFRETKKKDIKYNFIGISLIVIAAIMLVTDHGVLACIFFLVGFVGRFASTYMNKSNLKDSLNIDLIPAIFGSVFENVSYQPENHIDKSIIRETDMGFPFTRKEMNSIHGYDLISGIYHGVNFEVSNIQIFHEWRNSDNEKRSESVFKGQWIICDFKKRLSADVILSENRKKKRAKRGSIKTDNDEFNKYYSIYSENEEEVFYLLTPHMMEFIVSMDKKAVADTYFHFQKDGKVHIAINSERTLFELNNISRQSYDDMVNKLESEAKYIADLIDELRLSDSIYE